MNKKDINKLKETEENIQKGNFIKSEDLNRLWNYRLRNYNIIFFVRCWANGFKYKTKVFSSKD
jgi:hypothetical protein